MFRLGRSGKDSRSTDDSAHEESEKESKKSKHRSRTSSKNSPLVSPTVVCDVSGDSPTKIKIINVSHMNVENKLESVAKIDSDKTEKFEEKTVAPIEILDDSQSSQTLDIALPDELSEIENIEASAIPDLGGDRGEPEKEVPIAEEEGKIDIDVTLSTKSRSPSPR